MDSWLNASDSDIEDIRPELDLVSFENIQKYYSPYNDIVASYTLGETFSSHSRDWIGLFRSGWQDVSKFDDFQWASLDSFSHLLPRRRRVIFEAPGIKVGKQLNSYQFLYISSGDHVIGVSDLFHILDLPKESELNVDLLEQALVDEEGDGLVSSHEPFSGLLQDLEFSESDGYSILDLHQVVNIPLDLDQHDSVLSLYSPNESFNHRLIKKEKHRFMKEELPFNRIIDEQITEFFNASGVQKTLNQPSWLHMIFATTQPSVEMFSNEEKDKDQELVDLQQEESVCFEDKTSLCQSYNQYGSWLDDLQIVDKSSVVDDFYDHPFGQFANLLVDSHYESEPEPEASSIVEEFKSRLSDSFDHLGSLFSNEDWLDLPDYEPSGNLKQTRNEHKLYRESNPKSSYDFSEELNLDMMFHEKFSRKKKSNPKISRPKRKYKKSRKTKQTGSKAASISGSKENDTSSKSSNSSKPYSTSLPLVPFKQSKRMHRKRQIHFKKVNTAPGLQTTQILPEMSLAVVPFNVPFTPLVVKPSFLSDFTFFPTVQSSLAVVPYVPILPWANKSISKLIVPVTSNTPKPTFRFSKNHQHLSRSLRQSTGCYNCKVNRKLAVNYKERFNTAQKQIQNFQKERGDLQNQINAMMEELTQLISASNMEKTSVETLSNKMDDAVFALPEFNIIMDNLEENNALLDLAFQSAVVDNAQMRTDMVGIKDSLMSLNKQFLETENEFKSALHAIEKRQEKAEAASSNGWQSKNLKKIERLQTIMARREQMIETLQESVNNQSFEIVRNNDEINVLRKSVEIEKQRADKAETDLTKFKSKAEDKLPKRSNTPTWSQAVVKQPEMKNPPVLYTLCDETPTSTPRRTKEKMTYKLWKSYNDELKRQISEGKCRICGMKFSSFIDKRIVEEHINYHKQFKN